jgi:hypothetical protein
MSTIAPIRPDAWNFPLLLHVLGAMLLVGALALAGCALLFAWRGGSPALVQLGYRSMLLGALPAWIVMRVGAQWIASKEHYTGSSVPSWVDIGFNSADFGFVLIVITTILGGIALRRARRGERSTGLDRASAVIVSLLLVVYLVAIWAMTTKPA